MRWALCLALLVPGCGETRGPDRWLAISYVDPNDLNHFDVLGEYATSVACMAAARAAAGPGGRYECGLNCEQRPSGINICERTLGNER